MDIIEELYNRGRVAKHSTPCDACGLYIEECVWYSELFYNNKVYHIHDGEYCLARMKVKLGLCEPSFYSKVTPDYLEAYYRRHT